MRKYIIILALSLISIKGISQAIRPFAMFESGYESRQTMIYTTEYERFVLGMLPTYISGPYYAKLDFGASYKGFQVYTNDKTWFNKDRSIYFNPQVIQYTVGFSYSHKWLKVGAEHMCAHSVEALTFSDTHDRIYVRFVIGNPNKELW
jgi:hypothetical protein